MTPDDQLVAEAQAGDRLAMNELLRRHYDRIYAICRGIVGHDADAADAAQHALMSIVRALPRFDGRASFSTWTHRIATNASLDELRRRRRRPVASLDEPHDDGTPRDIADTTGDPLERIEEREILAAALTDVPDDFRIPMVMRDVGDLDYAEIAEELGLPVGTVKSRIARGRAALTHAYRSRSDHATGRADVGNHEPTDQRPTTEQ